MDTFSNISNAITESINTSNLVNNVLITPSGGTPVFNMNLGNASSQVSSSMSDMAQSQPNIMVFGFDKWGFNSRVGL